MEYNIVGMISVICFVVFSSMFVSENRKELVYVCVGVVIIQIYFLKPCF
jgi:hypothetical protein